MKVNSACCSVTLVSEHRSADFWLRVAAIGSWTMPADAAHAAPEFTCIVGDANAVEVATAANCNVVSLPNGVGKRR